MARKKLSEYRAKHIIADALGAQYVGWSLTADRKVPKLSEDTHYVVKVDQAVKQRFKRGLIKLDVAAQDVQHAIEELAEKGYEHFVIEPFRVFNEQERYISLKRDRKGVILSYSELGGVEIESHADSITSLVFDEVTLEEIAEETGFTTTQLATLRKLFDDAFLSLLEINPYIIVNGVVDILDAAVEVDPAGIDFTSLWTTDDVRSSALSLTEEEAVVQKLNEDSPASLSLELINPDGGIFLLLSGGGASVVIADEIFTLGKGDQLANYGEYSGNPNEEETRIYTEQVLSLLIKSKAKKKVMLVGGAVANFTDIASTFNGIILALGRYKKELKEQGVKVYVRRGGPRQKIGLARMTEALKDIGIFGGVYDHKTTIPTAVKHLLEEL